MLSVDCDIDLGVMTTGVWPVVLTEIQYGRQSLCWPETFLTFFSNMAGQILMIYGSNVFWKAPAKLSYVSEGYDGKAAQPFP